MSESRDSNEAQHPSSPAAALEARKAPTTKKPWLWNVVLLDDRHHSHDYVIRMTRELFGFTAERAVSFAQAVDSTGRAVCMTTHREHAELKCEQVFAFGKDLTVAECKGPMSCIIEPADGGGDGDGTTPP